VQKDLLLRNPFASDYASFGVQLLRKFRGTSLSIAITEQLRLLGLLWQVDFLDALM